MLVPITPILCQPQTPVIISATARETLLWAGLLVDPEQWPCPHKTMHSSKAGSPLAITIWQKAHAMGSLEPRYCCCRARAGSDPWEGGTWLCRGRLGMSSAWLWAECTWKAKHSMHSWRGWKADGADSRWCHLLVRAKQLVPYPVTLTPGSSWV